jgi:flavin-binding protein dodecin
MRDAEWGESDIDVRTMVQLSKALADDAIARGCEIMSPLPVYEVKKQEGVIARKQVSEEYDSIL